MHLLAERLQLILLVVACVLLPPLFSQAADMLDPAFGTKGVVITDFGVGDDEVSTMAMQADGKVLVAGFSSNSVTKDVAVARYLGDGTLDADFHAGGYLTFNVGDGNAAAQAMAVQEDGKIVVTGTYDDGGNEASAGIYVARLATDGYLDAGFGVDGKVVLSLNGLPAHAYDLQIAADGYILVAGTAGGVGKSQALVAKVDPHGVIDTRFGEDGIAIISREYETAAHSLVVHSDNTLLLGGYSRPEGITGLSLFRLQADGRLDTSFGTDGEARVAVKDGKAAIRDMAVQADNRLVVVGSLDNGSYREVLLGRFLPDGSVDTGFGTDGLVRNDLGYDSIGYSLAVQNDGSILATGFSETPTGKDIILLRYGTQTAGDQTSGGADDKEAGFDDLGSATVAGKSSPTDGEGNQEERQAAISSEQQGNALPAATYISESLSAYDDESRALTILADGRVLAAGYADNGNDSDFALLRFGAAAMDSLAGSQAGAGGVSTGNFTVSTVSIYNISRNSAMSGGTITEQASGDRSCETYCEAQCDTADEICYDACYDDCDASPTVVARGVCYGTARHPVYRAEPDDADAAADAGTTDDGTAPAILPPASKKTAYNYDTVLSGQTSDGSGTGTFGSHIVNITPDTTYYVRAYAVLSDDTVVYGNELSFRTDDACFIATAAYGSLLDRHVVLLRMFRDRFLKQSSLGRVFIAAYYDYSPAVAKIIETNTMLRQLVRICLWPWVIFSYVLLFHAGAVKTGVVLLIVIAGGAVTVKCNRLGISRK